MARTEICTLATTGGAPTISLVIAATALLILGIAIVLASRSRSRRGRRGLVLGLGVVALMGVVAFAPVLSASPAQAATGAASSACERAQPSVPASQPQGPEDQPPAEPHTDDNPESPLTEVVPDAPALAEAACGVEPTVVVPETDGVAYSQTRVDNTVTVTAAANEGYVIARGAATSWTFDVTPSTCQCVPEETNWGADATGFLLNVSTGLVTNLPAGWAQPLADQGATFAVSYDTTDTISGTWLATNGDLPSEVDPGTIEFTGTTARSDANGSVTPDGNLQFSLSSSGTGAYDAMAQAQADMQARYPDLGIYFIANNYSATSTTTLTVSIADSCGTVMTREYLGAPGGGGGGGNN